MRQKVWIVFSIVSVLAVLTGCGGEYIGISGDGVVSGGAVSGSAVSGGAVSGSAVKGQEVSEKAESRKEKKHRFATDSNYYTELYSARGDVYGIEQHRLNGAVVDTVDTFSLDTESLVFRGLVFVDEDGVYYVAGTGLYRIPLQKGEDGQDVMQTEKSELVIDDPNMSITSGFYVDSHYIVYLDRISYYGHYVKFDREKEKIVMREELPTPPSDYFTDYQIECGSNGYVIVSCGELGVFCQKLDSEEWDTVMNNKKEIESFCFFSKEIVSEKDIFYFIDDGDGEEKISLYDAQKQKRRVFLKEEEMKEQLLQASGLRESEINCLYPWELYIDQGRLYINIQCNWIKGNTYYSSCYVFSRDLEHEEHLVYEERLTECIHKYSDVKKIKKGTVISHKGTFSFQREIGSICDIVDGKALVRLYDSEKDEYKMGCYELESGRFYKPKRGEKDYYLFFYNNEVFYDLGWELEIGDIGEDASDFIED